MKTVKKILFLTSAVLLVSCGNEKPVFSFSTEDKRTEEGKGRTVSDSLEKDTLLEDYQNEPVSIISYALEKQASYPYSLSMMDGVAKSTTFGIKVNQIIRSANLYTPEENFNQNISTSSLVSTADRFYDKKDGYVLAYNAKKSSEWKDMDLSEKYSYDDYIQKYGKLIKSRYFCKNSDKEGDVIPETYQSDTEKIDECHEVNAISMYRYSKDTILSHELKKTESGYELFMKLDPNKATVYSKVQMKMTGGLSDYPNFSSSQITYHLDRELNLISADSKDSYEAKMTLILTDIQMESHFTYLHSEDGIFRKGNVEKRVNVPAMEEEIFEGYELID